MSRVAAHEKDRVRVFAVNGTAGLEGQAQTFLTPPEGGNQPPRPDPAHLAQLLGVAVLDTSYIELFALSDIAEIGLPGYLEQGFDIAPKTLGADRTRLEALEGQVLIVLSEAFGGVAVTLRPGAGLTLIGTYATASAVAPGPIPLPNPGGAAMPPPARTPEPGRRRLGSGLIALIIVAALALAAVFILMLSGGPR